MLARLNAIAASIGPIEILQDHKSMTQLGAFLKPVRIEALMHKTFANEPMDCLLLALEKLSSNVDSDQNRDAALAWLSQVATAHANRKQPDFWHDLANTIRVDLLAQLNGLRLEQVWESKQKAETELANNELDQNAKDATAKIHKLLIGLLGFHFGIGVELTDQAVAEYNKLLQRTDDPAVKQLITQRIKALSEHEYLKHESFGFSKERFDELRKNRTCLQEFIRECCLDGEVSARPEYEAKLTKDIHYMAALTIFMPPVALFAIPTAFLGTPIFKLIDRIRYSKDQHDNAIYYWILDCAHPWVKEYIVKEAKKLCPGYDNVSTHVNSLNERCNEKMQPLSNFYPGQKVKEARDSLMFRRSNLSNAEYSSMSAILDSVEASIEEYKNHINALQRLSSSVNCMADYMGDYKRQLRANDGVFHAKDHEDKRFNNVCLADLPLHLNVAFEVEFNARHARAAALKNDISSRLLSINMQSQEAVRVARENQQNQRSRAEQLQQNVRKMI